MEIKELTIGDVKLENNIVLAPMAGVTDLPFRMLCKENGAGLVCTEMASAKAIFYHDEKTKKLLNTKGEVGPIQMQIFGSEIESMQYAAKQVEKIADIIDINMGCPAPKVVKNGDGSKLLLDLDLLEDIVASVVRVVEKPVTVKIRKGWDENHIVAIEAAKAIQRAGACGITIHGRTRAEFYTGKADWDIIKKIKEEVQIPVIGNGDIIDEITAQEMFKQTRVDGIMIGRASFGNPWIFREIIHYLKTGQKLEKPTLEEKRDTIVRHIKMEVEEKGEKTAVREMRKQISWYLKNLKDASQMREHINKIEEKEELIQVITEYFNSL